MIFDTDIFIWAQRGNGKAAEAIDRAKERFLSVQTYMELIQSAKSKKQHENMKDFLYSYGFTVLPLTENNMTLLSSNVKYFRPIKDLKLKAFKP